MIPKIIHYCWFGKNPKPKVVQKCIASWKKYCPDYEIREWNENNFDISCCDYVKQAYEQKKWAYVSDYARHFILYEYGGIYLDTDVELLKSMDDILTANVLALEDKDSIASGLVMACERHNAFCKWMINDYEKDQFVLESSNPYTVCKRTTKYFDDKGFVHENKTQQIDGFTIYDTSYFNPYDMNTGKIMITKNTISIHHYAGTWVSKYDKFRGNVFKFLNRVFGKNIATKIRKIIGRKK